MTSHRGPTITYYQNSYYHLYSQHSIPPPHTTQSRAYTAIPRVEPHAHPHYSRPPITQSIYILETEDWEHQRNIKAWVEEQRKYQASGEYTRARANPDTPPGVEEDIYRSYDGGRDRRGKPVAAEYLRIQEMRRAEMRREAEKRRVAAEKARAHVEYLERERRERERAEKHALEAWNRYEEGWARLTKSTEQLSFATIPWPMLKPPSSVDKINVAAVTLFLMSPVHSRDVSRKERLRNAQLRWHPDRFRRYLNRVQVEDRVAVEEGVGVIARGLNELMTREANARGISMS